MRDAAQHIRAAETLRQPLDGEGMQTAPRLLRGGLDLQRCAQLPTKSENCGWPIVRYIART
jgi:hypothetical protein